MLKIKVYRLKNLEEDYEDDSDTLSEKDEEYSNDEN